MSQYNKQHFISIFLPGYAVTAQDMQDFVDSCLFSIDDVGYDYHYKCIIPPYVPVTTFSLASQQLLKAPSLAYINPITVDFSNNALTFFQTSLNLVNLQHLIIDHNSLTVLVIFPDSVNLLTIDSSYNSLTFLEIQSTLISLTHLYFSDNSIINILFPATLTSLVVADFSNNAINISSMEVLLFQIASSGASCAVNVSGGTNAAKSTWSPTTLAAELTIIANGGSVSSNL